MEGNDEEEFKIFKKKIKILAKCKNVDKSKNFDKPNNCWEKINF